MNTISPTTIDPSEIEKFSRIAEEWWDLGGKFKPLHQLNPVRVGYIRDKIRIEDLRLKIEDLSPNLKSSILNLQSITMLDIGCGGGLLSEPMARLGAQVTGIDASDKNIKIASLHAQKSGLDINYICTSAEELAAQGRQFDIVLNMEVIEHVADVGLFMEACCKLVKPGGVMFIATLNRTLKSFAFAKVGAEYILNWLPRGTHIFEKFLKPSEINTHLENNGLRLQEIKGVSFNPLRSQWNLSDDISVNYMMFAVKPADAA